MWSIVIATMLSVSAEPAIPVVVASYKTLKECRLELIDVSNSLDYKLVVSPLLGYSVKKDTKDKTIVAFCVKQQQSI